MVQKPLTWSKTPGQAGILP